MAPDINDITPLTLPRDMVRVVFPLNQSDPLPDIATLPDQVSRWNYAGDPGTPVTVTYGFSGTAPDYDPGDNVADTPNYTAYDDAEKANVATVLAAYQAVTGITFELVADPADAQMVFRKADLAEFVSGFAYFPPFNAESEVHGDAYFNTAGAGQAYLTFHELGHALGLGHAFDAGHPNPEDYGIAGGRHLSVVDQNFQPKPFYLTGTESGYSLNTIFHPTTPMPLDILALQMLYGQNAATNAGDTVYTYAVNPNFYQTIWDGGGKDTIDLSNQTSACIVSLVAGSYSSIGLRDPFAGFSQSVINSVTTGIGRTAGQYNDGSNLLAIAFDCVIEDATGGSAGDRLIGNTAANVLRGNAGSDTLTGAGGNDTLDGGTGNDTMKGGTGNDIYVRNATGDAVTELTGQGTDTVKSAVTYTLGANVENLTLTGTGAVNGTGNTVGNTLTGNAGNNSLNGGGGADTLKGLGGTDTLTWSATDTLFDGGTGTDTLKVTSGHLNLTTIANTKILNVEILNLTGGGNNILTLNKADLLDISSTANTLKVLGDAGDSINIVGAFTDTGVVSGGFHKYTVGAASAILLVDVDITNVA